MNAFDLAVVMVIVLSAVFAFARGFVREALSIAAWVGAAAATLDGYNAVYRLTLRVVTTPLLAELLAGAGLFLVSLVVLTVLSGYAARLIRASGASPIDRTLGLIFGMGRGAALVLLAYLFLDIGLPPNDRPDWIREARCEPYLAEGAGWLRTLLPPGWQLKAVSTVATQRAGEQADEAKRAMRALANPPPPSNHPAAAAQRESDQTGEAQRAMRAFENPAAPANQAGVPRYQPAERRDLDRLIENAH